jgi:high-affinity iron transporter
VFSNYLIGLREGLEASLVVCILIAYLVKTGRRDALRPIWAGIGVAVALALGFGCALEFGSQELTFEAQEMLGGSLSIIAVGLVTWMVFWMRRTARYLKSELHGRLDTALALGPLALGLTGLIAVGREGLETALFFYASVQTAGSGTSQPLIGFVLGIVVAVVLGVLIYRGAVRINLSKFFRYTGVALVVVAAGILSYGIHDLQEAGFLPGLNTLAFDVSGAVPPGSWYGTLLKGTVNFTPATTWLQAVAWTLYLVVVMTFFLRPARTAPAPAGPTPATVGTPR